MPKLQTLQKNPLPSQNRNITTTMMAIMFLLQLQYPDALKFEPLDLHKQFIDRRFRVWFQYFL